MRSFIATCLTFLLSSAYAGDQAPGPAQEPAPNDPRALEHFTVTCRPTEVEVGEKVACVVFGRQADLTSLDLTADSSWSKGATNSPSTTTATLDDARAGTISMTATFITGHGIFRDTASIKVKAPHVLSYFAITCDVGEVKVGQPWRCFASAWYLDDPDQQVDVRGLAKWDRGPEGTATEDDAKAGTIPISATLEGESRSTSLKVTPHVLTKMFIDCSKEEIGVGETTECRAFGLYSDDLHTVAKLNPRWERGPEVTATSDDVRAGTISVTAELEGKSASASIKVKPAHVLTSLTVSCSKEELKVNETVTCSATGKYADTARFVALMDAAWERGPAVTATEADAEAGTIAVTATVEGLKGTASIKVTPHLLRKMTIDCLKEEIEVGDTTECRAFGLYSDDPHTIVKLNPKWDRGPKVTALLGDARAGSISVSASFEAFSATGSIKVTPVHILKSLKVSCDHEEVKVGETAVCMATGMYADSQRFVMLSDAEWDPGSTVTATEADAAAGHIQVTARLAGLVDTVSVKVAPQVSSGRKAACENAAAQLKAIDGILRQALTDGAAVIKLIPKEGEPTAASAGAMVDAATKIKELNTSMPKMQTAVQALAAALQTLAEAPGSAAQPEKQPADAADAGAPAAGGSGEEAACAPFDTPGRVQAALKTAAASLDDLGDVLANVQGTFTARNTQLGQVAAKIKQGLDMGPAAVEKAKASGDQAKIKAAEDAVKTITEVGKNTEKEKTNLQQGSEAAQQAQNQVGAIKGLLNVPTSGQ